MESKKQLNVEIRPMANDDWQAVEAIYLEGIATGHATFETKSPGWEAWDCSFHQTCRLVAEVEGEVVGWAALSPVSNRYVYGGVAQVEIYVGRNKRGTGIGTKLMRMLITLSEVEGFWTLESQMFPENKAGLALHLKNGFRKVGIRERIGNHEGVWRDNVLLERRSK